MRIPSDFNCSLAENRKGYNLNHVSRLLLEDEASHDIGTPNSVTWLIVHLRCLEIYNLLFPNLIYD